MANYKLFNALVKF